MNERMLFWPLNRSLSREFSLKASLLVFFLLKHSAFQSMFSSQTVLTPCWKEFCFNVAFSLVLCTHISHVIL